MRGLKPPGMTSQVEKTSGDVWKAKEAVTSTSGIGPVKATKRLMSPKKCQETKKLNEMKIEDVFLNSEYFKYHAGGNPSSLSFCSGDNGENHWTVDPKPEVSVPKKPARNIPSETIKSDTVVVEKAKQTQQTLEVKAKTPPLIPGEHSEQKANKLLKGILSGKGRLDRDLITLITEQMFLAERELQITRTHLVETISKLNERDLEILQLHEKIQKLQMNKKKEKPLDWSPKTSEDYQRLVMASEKLKKQVSDMEEFLNDYGLVWVGEKETKPDFDKIVKSFQRLNSVASEPKIIQTTMGAKFELPREIPVVLYANGILLRGRDFREYGNPSTILFLQDVEDGFFPGELQLEFPEGVPFEVVDKRNEVYVTGMKTPAFQGHGNRLGSTIEGKPSTLVFLEPVKKVRSCDVGGYEPPKKYPMMKTQKKRPRNGGEKNAMAIHMQMPDAGAEEETSAEELLNVKVRYGGERTRSFLLRVKEKERMFEFQVALQRKLCEMFHDECVSKGLTNNKGTDFEVHVYGRSPFRLSDHLLEFPVDCGIVNNCVINVSEI